MTQRSSKTKFLVIVLAVGLIGGMGGGYLIAQTQIGEPDSQLQELDSQASNIQNEIQELKDRIDEQETELQEIHTQALNRENEIKELKDQIGEHESALQELNNQTSNLQNEIQELEDEIDEYESQLQELNTQALNIQNEIQELKDRIGEHETELQELDSQASNIQNEIQELKAAIAALQSQTKETWSVTQIGNDVQIAYGKGVHFPQYASLDISSSYFRMVPPNSTWGTSVILFPCFWEKGNYYQGNLKQALSYDWHVADTDGNYLVLSFEGEIANLTVEGEVRIDPPEEQSISAIVSVNVSGNIELDNRPGEAFKPVMLSSMRISADMWDTQSAFVDTQSFQIPSSGWVIEPPTIGSTFGLKGGTSNWKNNAPTIKLVLDQNMQITGWVTSSNDPNDDNVGFWSATDEVIHFWEYTLISTKE
jgi:peptidoglycan hydrolase CwlO-like protein